MSINAVRFTRSLCLATLLLLACGGLQAAGRIDAVIPDTLGPGQATKLSLEVSQWQSNTQLMVVPGGPYTSHRLTLATRPTAIATDGRLAFVASQGGLLQIVEFPTADAARITGQLTLEGGEITGLYPNGRRLLVTIAGVGATLLDVALPTEIIQLWTYHRAAPILDAILHDTETYLLGERELERLIFEEMAPTEPAQRWALPVSANHFVLQDNTALITGPEGLSSLALDEGQARLLDQHPTNGQALDLQLAAGLALVNDGPGGLLVYDAAEPGKLRWLGSHSKRGPITAFAIDTDRAWVGLENQTVLTIALGNPQLPTAQSALRLDAPLVALAAAGDTVFAATEQGLQRLSFATSPVADISPEGVNLGGSRRGVIRDDILYVADWFSGLHLYDISQPHHPRHLGNYHTPGSSKGVELMGNYALVGDDDQGLQIIDIRNPRAPRHVAELSSLGLAYTMKRLGTTLYLADHRGGFQIIDLSDIEHPRVLGALDTPGKSWAIDVAEKDATRTAFVADDNDGLLVFDVTDPTHITLIGSFDPGGNAEDIVIRDGLAYMAFFDRGLYILDISNPRQPRPVSQLDIPGNARGIQLVNGLAYVAGWESGLQIVDIRNPAAPRIIGSYDTRGATWGVNVEGDNAFLLDWWGGIQVIDVSMPTRPRLAGRYQARGTLQRLRTKGNYLFAASGAGGLQVFDSRNPLNPIWSRGIDLPGEAKDLWLDEDRAYVALGDGGLSILDTLDPFYTRPIGGLETGTPVELVRAAGNTVFIANHQQGLRVMDARDPRHLVELSRINRTINDLWLDDTGLFIADPDGMQLLTVAADGDLHPLARYASNEVRLVRSQGNLTAAYLADGSVQLLTFSNGAFSPLGRLQLHEPLVDLQLAGERLYMLGKHSGLLVADISTPASPLLTLRYPASGEHTSFALSAKAAFFAGETRMASVQLLPPIQLTTINQNQLQLNLPAGLPAGHYHLETLSHGREDVLLPNAFESSYSRPDSKKYNLKTLKSLMKQPLKAPATP